MKKFRSLRKVNIKIILPYMLGLKMNSVLDALLGYGRGLQIVFRMVLIRPFDNTFSGKLDA